jgi:hypothetical protein
MNPKLRANRAERRGMFSEPGKEIEVHHCRRKEIGRDNGITPAVERERIGDGFGKKGIEGHGGFQPCRIFRLLTKRKWDLRWRPETRSFVAA